MNFLYIVELFVFNLCCLTIYFKGELNYLISPKFNTIYIVGILLINIIFVLYCSYCFFCFRKVKKFFKLDFTIVLAIPVFIAFFSDKNLKLNELISNKFKGHISFKQFNEVKKASGLKIKKSHKIETFQKKNLYNKLNIMQVYEDLNNFTTEKEIKKYSYKIEFIGKNVFQGEDDIGIELYENEIMLIRMIMVCCAADMVPLGIVVENNSKIKYDSYDCWFKVKGVIEFVKSKNGGFVGFVKDEIIEKIPPPQPEWLYPDLNSIINSNS